jgi:pyruvate/2-oxoglutarate dehydrogenase complex dihydrolipoamide acyltransferase (E2) component
VSTFLVSLGVVAAAVGVLWIALSDPDQPAMIGRRTGRADRLARSARQVPPAAERSPERPAATAAAPPAAAPTATQRSLLRSLRDRTRSAVALAILVTFMGVVLAAMVGTALALAVRAFTRAVQ